MTIYQGYMHTKEIPILLRAHLWGIVNDPNIYFNTISIKIVGVLKFKIISRQNGVYFLTFFQNK